MSAGTFFGAILSGQVGTILGRRIGIAAYLVVFCAGVACQTAAKAVPLFAVGRVLAGLGVGGVSCLVPIYQSETAPKQFRGAIVGAYQLFIVSFASSSIRRELRVLTLVIAQTIGLLIAAVVVERTQSRNDPSCYQIPIGIQVRLTADCNRKTSGVR